MRNFIDLLTEDWDKNIDAFGYGHNPQAIRVDVFRNPSRAEFAKLIQESEFKKLRGLLDGLDLLVWDAGLTTHGDVQKHYPNADSIYLILNRDHLEWSDINYEGNDEDDYEEFPYGSHLRKKITKAHQCKALVRLYGPNFVIVGQDGETGESHPMTPEWIAANCRPENVTESIVHYARGLGGDQDLVIALSPSRSEWNGRFPDGAAGVLMMDGRVVIGRGTCLAHDVICSYAGLNIRNEKYRLQLGHKAGYAELWIDSEELTSEDEEMTSEEVAAAILESYGATVEEIAAEIRAAIKPFAGDIPIRGIPMDTSSSSPLFQTDRNFIHWCWIEGDEPFADRTPPPFRDEWMPIARKIRDLGGNFVVTREEGLSDHVLGYDRKAFYDFSSYIGRKYLDYHHEGEDCVYSPGSQWSEFIEKMQDH